MRRILTEIKKYSIIIIIVSAVLGVLLIAFPDRMLAYTSLFMGGAFIACGIFAIVNYLIKRRFVFTLTLGIIAVVSGLIICLAYRQIISVIVFLMGIFLLVGGLVNLVNAFYVASAMPHSWIVTTVLSVASVALGIVSLTNPFHAQNTLVQFLGIALLVFAALELIAYFQVREISKKVRDRLKDTKDSDGTIEVEYREVDDH